MPISTNMIVRVAHADVAMDMAFPRSVAHWHREKKSERPWPIRAGDCDQLLIGKDDAVVIDGDCSNRVSAPEGGIIHIYGDLNAAIDVDGHYEIIIGGDVGPSACISAAGFCHVFVGGKFGGMLQSSDSAKVWIGSSFDGTLKSGSPSTHLYIGGDFNGQILPCGTAALLWLTVAGFATNASLTKIADYNYTQFNASIAYSDVAPGIYPLNGHHKKVSGGSSYNRWCVATNRRDE